MKKSQSIFQKGGLSLILLLSLTFISSSAFSEVIKIPEFKHTICLTNTAQMQEQKLYLSCNYRNFLEFLTGVRNSEVENVLVNQYTEDKKNEFGKTNCYEYLVPRQKVRIRTRGKFMCRMRMRATAITSAGVTHSTMDQGLDAFNLTLSATYFGREIFGVNELTMSGIQASIESYQRYSNGKFYFKPMKHISQDRDILGGIQNPYTQRMEYYSCREKREAYGNGIPEINITEYRGKIIKVESIPGMTEDTGVYVPEFNDNNGVLVSSSSNGLHKEYVVRAKDTDGREYCLKVIGSFEDGRKMYMTDNSCKFEEKESLGFCINPS